MFTLENIQFYHPSFNESNFVEKGEFTNISAVNLDDNNVAVKLKSNDPLNMSESDG